MINGPRKSAVQEVATLLIGLEHNGDFLFTLQSRTNLCRLCFNINEIFTF